MDTTTPAICDLPTHAVADPAILYFGTPVVLISTLNEDGSPNLAPMSSAWWLGWGCMLGLTSGSRTNAKSPADRPVRSQSALGRPCPSRQSVGDDDRSNPVPRYKEIMGFQYVADKFARAGLATRSSPIW